MKKVLIVALVGFVFNACQKPALNESAEATSDTTQTESLQSAYNTEQMYIIKSNGVGDIAIGTTWESIENSLPIAQIDTVRHDEPGTGSYLLRLAETQEFGLITDLSQNELVALTFFTTPFATEKGISAQKSSFADLKAAYSIEGLSVPDDGTLNVSVKELPNVSFVFEDETLRGLVESEGDQPAENKVPAGVKVAKIYLFKQIQ
jgi:hypothetical protein